MNKPFWQEFALRMCGLLGVKPEGVERIDIAIEGGKPPKITVTRSLWGETGEDKQVIDVFEAAEWKIKDQ